MFYYDEISLQKTLNEPLKKVYHIYLLDYHNLLTIKDLNTYLQEGHVQGTRRASSRGKKGMFCMLERPCLGQSKGPCG
jgi:hypothetical protein